MWGWLCVDEQVANKINWKYVNATNINRYLEQTNGTNEINCQFSKVQAFTSRTQCVLHTFRYVWKMDFYRVKVNFCAAHITHIFHAAFVQQLLQYNYFATCQYWTYTKIFRYFTYLWMSRAVIVSVSLFVFVCTFNM